MFDAHNHLQRLPDPQQIVSRLRTAGITGCIVNATAQDDWDAVAQLAADFPSFAHPAFGFHPWRAHERTPDWLRQLEKRLDSNPSASIGECGLDGWVDSPPLDIQREVFLPQLALARERNLPITIHALKAWEPLFQALQQEPPPERGFLLHSFGGSLELAQRLADLGAWFSFSGYFLHPRKAKTLEVFRHLPRERLLLETDAPDMTPPGEFIAEPLPGGKNHPLNLLRIAEGLSAALELPLEELSRLTENNARRFFSLATANGGGTFLSPLS